MSVTSQIKNVRLLFQWALFVVPSSLFAQDGLNISLSSGSTNTLTLQTTATTNDLYLAYESNGITLNDQIDLRYPQGFEIQAVNVPAGWRFQELSVTPVERVATWFFEGFDSSNNAEFHNFATALDFSFQIITSGEVPDLELTLQAQLTVFRQADNQLVRAFINESQTATTHSTPLASFRRANSLPSDGAQDIGDANGDGIPNLLHYAFGLGPVTSSITDRILFPEVMPSENQVSVSYVRRKDPTLDGINYRLQFSDNLGRWTDLASLPAPESVTTLNDNYERVVYRFSESDSVSFYRLAVSVD